MNEFTKKDFSYLSKYLRVALDHLYDYDMPIGSPLYIVYSLLNLCEEISDSNC